MIVDITPVVDMMDGRVRIWSGWKGWSKAKMQREEIFPTTRCEQSFYGIPADCPRNPHAFLGRFYGDNFMDSGEVDTNFWAVGKKGKKKKKKKKKNR